jgi:hypothetical protein
VVQASALAALVAFGAPVAARADGAFPAGETVLVPADRPQEILLVTNFGVIRSEDGGQSWRWSCERDENAFGSFYQFGPAPRRRLFAVANQQVVYSDDATCSWNVAGGLIAGQAVTDVFADPTNAERVVAVTVTGGVHAVFESSNGGATFGAMLYQAAGGDVVNGVEIARSDPRVLYVALASTEREPKLARSGDGGATWTVQGLSAGLGRGFARIIAVDPDDPNLVVLRWSSAEGGEAIAVTRDGGATVAKPLSIPTTFTSFARLPDATLVVSGTTFVNQTVVPALFVSRDGGTSFQENRAVPGVRALAQRSGILYAATDNFGDGYALGASSDAGASWQPVMRFDQIQSIMPCVQANAQCQASCAALAGVGFGSPGVIWDRAVCGTAPNMTGAGGTGGSRPPSDNGCGLAPGSAAAASVQTGLGLAFALAVLGLGRRRKLF